MDRDEMLKIKWKPYMEIEYKHPRMEEGVVCMLVSIHFDDEILELQSYDTEAAFFTTIQNCSIPKRMKAVAVNGKRVQPVILSATSKETQNFNNTNPAS